MRLAWTQGTAFFMAEVVYRDGKPEFANKKKILDGRDLPFKCSLETQNVRPPDEKELIFSAYGYQGTEVMGLDIATGKVVNHGKPTRQSNIRALAEGHDGLIYGVVEEPHHALQGVGQPDALDDVGRLAHDLLEEAGLRRGQPAAQVALHHLLFFDELEIHAVGFARSPAVRHIALAAGTGGASFVTLRRRGAPAVEILVAD